VQLGNNAVQRRLDRIAGTFKPAAITREAGR